MVTRKEYVDFAHYCYDLVPEKDFKQNKNDYRTDLKEAGWSSVDINDPETGYDATIYKNSDNKEIVIAYAGTNPFEMDDLKNDLSIKDSEIMSQLDKAIETYMSVANENNKDYKITVVGHSLGGALAQLIAALFDIDGISFNAPGVSHLLPILAERYKFNMSTDPESYTNIVNYNTANELLNNINIGMGYNHIGPSYILPASEKNNSVLAHNDFEAMKSPYTIPRDLWEKQNRNRCNQLKTGGFATDMTTGAVSTFSGGLQFAPESKALLKGALIGAFTAAEGARQAPYNDPLLVDLDGDGIETTTLENGVYFDHAVDGFKELSAWVADDDGILVLDKNQNGIIDDGSEIFGDNYVKLDGSKATSGFDALTDFDLNNDGKITTDEFGDIRVLKGDGTLLTLEDAGIQSINLTYTNKNKKDDIGNVQKTDGTFVKTDGSTGVIGDYLFASDSINTIATDWVEVPEDIAELPDIAGFGNVYSLHQAMARNSELKDLIQAFPSAPDARARLDFVKQIIYKWAGVENVPTDSRGPHYDGRDLAALEKFIGRGFVGMNTGNHQISPNPITNAAKILSNCFNMLQEYIYAELEAQTILKPLFEMLEFSFDETSDKFLYNISPVQNHIDNAISANPTDGKTLLLDFARTFVHLGLEENSNYADFKAHYAALGKEYELLLSSVDKINLYGTDQDDTIDGSSEQDAVFAYGGNDTITTRQGDDLVYAGDGDDNIDTCMGNDVIFGENGNDTIDAGEGNDYIDGGDGNDRIFSGKGDDTIIGGKGDDYMEDVKSGGNDTYIFNKGDGNDTISNWHGDDKIIFGEGIAPSNLKFIGDKKDIIIKFTDSPNDSIRIVNFVQYEDYRIETFEFADGSVLTADDVIADIVVEGTNSDDIIYGTTLADTIYGFDGNDKIYSQGGADRVFAGAGNDSIYNSNGNDFIDPGDGDDKVYTSNKFDETILGSKGNDYFEDLDGGNETFIFSAGDGIDTIYNKFGDNDTVRFEASVDKNNIAFFVDNSHNLLIDYGANAGEDVLKIRAQQSSEICAIENFEFADADGNLSTLSAADITKIIQDMTAFAAENEISITSTADVKDNPDLMNLIASSIAA